MLPGPQGEAGWGSALGKRLFLLSAASPSSVVEQQDPERCAPVTLPRPGAVLEPRLGLGLGLRLPWPGPVSSPLRFGGPQHRHGTLSSGTPRCSWEYAEGKGNCILSSLPGQP